MNKITPDPIPVSQLEETLCSPSSGAVVTFCGKVREDHKEAKKVAGLDYEAYPAMAEKVFDRISAEARKRFGAKTIHIVHRTGKLKVGEAAVWIGVASAHRAEAFEACRYVIDEIKKYAPIWKKEHD